MDDLSILTRVAELCDRIQASQMYLGIVMC